MDEARVRMIQLARKGYFCSQILIMLGLEARGEKNPDLIRAMDGLAGGCDEGSCTCGSLTGGCCLIALFAGRGNEHEQRNPGYRQMMQELVRWFWKSYGFNYGGIDCMAISEAGRPENASQRCWTIMESVYLKVEEILTSHGVVMCKHDCYAS